MTKKYIILITFSLCFFLIVGIKFFSPFSNKEKSIDNIATESSIVEDKIKIGYMPFTTNWPVFLAVEKGIFKKQGLDVELVRFNSGVDAANALAKGEIVSQVVNTFSDLFNLENRAPGLIKIYAIQQSSDKNHGEVLIAKKGLNINSVEDLKGKKIGVLPGSFSEVFIKLAYKDILDLGKEAELVKLTPDLHLSSLESGQIQAFLAIEPFATLAVEKEIGFVLEEHSWGRVREPFPVTAYTLSTKHIEENPDLTNKVVKAIEEAILFGRKNPDKAHKSAALYVSVPEDSILKLRYLDDVLLDEIKIEDLEDIAEIYFNQGLIENHVNVKNMLYLQEKE